MARTERGITAERSRSSKDFGRKAASEEPRGKLLIVCEGSKTEPHYFESARYEYRISQADVVICGKECGSAPISVVKYALTRFEQSKHKYEKVFCVFDRDSHPSYQEAIDLVRSHSANGFTAITSIPSFEFWLLLHFVDSRKEYIRTGKKSPGDLVVGDLTSHFEREFGYSYSKGQDHVFELLLGRLKDASKRAKRCISDAEATNNPNPSTNVFELINTLRNISIPPLPEI